MKTKSMKKPKKLSNKPSKKLSARARRKEATMINIQALKKRVDKIEDVLRILKVTLIMNLE
jgi:hypothetical protein